MFLKHKMTRRTLILGAGAVFAAGVTRAQWREDVAEKLTPPEAHALALEGRITLVDIRRPDEWAATGVGEGAHPIDMRRDDFLTELLALVEGDTDAPVAVICARGVRSARLSRALDDAGFTNIIDIPEGMLGSRAGPGWLNRELPVVKS